jgi:hypothetical protein
MYSFLGDTLLEFLLPCYWICVSIRYPIPKYLFYIGIILLVHSFYNIKELFSFPSVFCL